MLCKYDLRAVLAYIVNVNDSTSDMNKWSIEYAITIDVPNFNTSPYYDADISSVAKTTMCSLQRKTYGDSVTLQDNNNNKYKTPIDQLYRFDEWDYTKHPKSPAIEYPFKSIMMFLPAGIVAGSESSSNVM